MPGGVVRRCSVKNMFLKLSQKSQENTRTGVSFNKAAYSFVEKRRLRCVFLRILRNFLEYLLYIVTNMFIANVIYNHDNYRRGPKFSCKNMGIKELSIKKRGRGLSTALDE